MDYGRNVVFFGVKKNPYPYYKQADYIICSSEYEGYPVVFIESLVFGKKIITTDVSDAKIDIADKFGIVVEKNELAIFEAMKSIILKDKKENGYYRRIKKANNKFNVEAYNDKILQKLREII